MVILVAIAASQVAAAHGDQMREHWMPAGKQSPADEAGVTKFELNEFAFSHLTEKLRSAYM